MSFPRYESYKDSDVEWLGQVPAHWAILKSQDLARNAPYSFVDGPFGSDLKNEEYTDDGVPLIQLNNITEGAHVLNDIKYISEAKADALSKHNAQPGDIVIAKMADPVARAAIVRGDFQRYVIVADCIRFSVDQKKAIPNFAIFAINSRYFRANAEGVSSGITRLRINLGALKKLKLAIPPLAEQQAIAAFLDRETSKMDALIAEQQRLIELLKEKRQAVIFHAVTKGLTPDAPMKDSSVEWLGDVLEHWIVCALNYRYEIALGKMLDEKRITGMHLAPYLRNVDVQWGRINIENLPEMDFSGDDLIRYSLQQGDLLVCEGGEVGRAAIWNAEIKECYYQKALHRLRARQSAIDQPVFLFWVFNAIAQLGIFAGSEGKATINHLTAETLRRYVFAFPPREEQIFIAGFLNEESAKLDTLIAEAQRSIALLQERRTALISAAVTGKIDVRGLVAVQSQIEAAA
jgi:type I restriction enzyme S subunit